MGAYDGWEVVEDGWVECCATIPGSAPPAVPWYMGNKCFFMRDRCLASAGKPIPIVGARMQVRGYTGPVGGLGGIVLDKGRRTISQTGYPLTQAGDFSTNQQNLLVGALALDGSGTRCMEKDWSIDQAPLYVPGSDALYWDLVFGGASPGQIQTFAQLRLLVPPGMSEDWPQSMLTATTGGNDANTVILVHGAGPSGSVAFQDSSFRNYTMRWLGGVRLQNGKVTFDGTSGMLCPDMTPPGYEYVGPVQDWNWQNENFTIDLLVTPGPAGSSGVIVSTGYNRAPLQAYQNASGTIGLYAASSGTAPWDVANNVTIGTAVPGEESHLAVARSGDQLLAFFNGALVTTQPIPTGGLYDPYDAANGNGRPTFGAQCVLDVNGNVTGAGYFWPGAMREIRVSNVARWTAAFAPPTPPYAP